MAAKKTTKKTKASTTPNKVESPKAGPAPKGRGGPRAGSKTGFILSQPTEMLAKDVVAAGAKAGLDFSDKFVWSVRSAEKSKGAKGAVSPAPATKAVAPKKIATPKKTIGRPKTAPTSNDALSSAGSLEEQLFSLALEVGIARAEAIVRRARQQIDGLRL